MRLRRCSNGEIIKIPSTDIIGAGGEARIFAVEGAPRLAAKVYHRPTREHALKLAAMLANPPADPLANQLQVSIAWPTDLLTPVHDMGRPIAFLMPRVTGMHPIIDFYHPKSRREKHPLFNYKYLVRTTANLAACVGAVHERGYVIGDLNESNILVGETALVCLVDTDSFQVPHPQNQRVFRCRVGKPEFTPPELQAVKFDWVDRRREHDLFGLAILFFQMLMEGVHPFAGRHAGRGESPTLEERIGAGRFPYSLKSARGTMPMPTAPPFELLHPCIRDLFLQCFIEGHTNPSRRPGAQDWQRALLEMEKQLVCCPVNLQHHYGSHLVACPWCERKRLLAGRDPFPSRESIEKREHRRGLRLGRRRFVITRPEYAAAIAIAKAAAARKERQRVLLPILVCLVAVGLILYWGWVFHLIGAGQ
jgi:DNA-binding helix-hairpin-helix protein with protein kinase domain